MPRIGDSFNPHSQISRDMREEHEHAKAEVRKQQRIERKRLKDELQHARMQKNARRRSKKLVDKLRTMTGRANFDDIIRLVRMLDEIAKDYDLGDVW